MSCFTISPVSARNELGGPLRLSCMISPLRSPLSDRSRMWNVSPGSGLVKRPGWMTWVSRSVRMVTTYSRSNLRLHGIARWFTNATAIAMMTASAISGRATTQIFAPDAVSTISSLSLLSRLSVWRVAISSANGAMTASRLGSASVVILTSIQTSWPWLVTTLS